MEVHPNLWLSHTRGVFLPFFTAKDATVLRALCREFKEKRKWRDEETITKV